MSKTLIRIFQNNNGGIEAQQMTSHCTHDELLRILGVIVVVKKLVVDNVGTEEMEDDEIDSVRRLLDD